MSELLQACIGILKDPPAAVDILENLGQEQIGEDSRPQILPAHDIGHINEHSGASASCNRADQNDALLVGKAIPVYLRAKLVELPAYCALDHLVIQEKTQPAQHPELAGAIRFDFTNRNLH